MVASIFVFMAVLVAACGCAAVTVNESDYLSPLLTDHPAVAGAQGALATAHGMERSARAIDNPSIDVELESPGDVDQLTMILAWTPPIDGRRGLNTAAARDNLEATESALEWKLLALRAEFRETYARWALAAERYALLRSQLGMFRTIVEQAQNRERVGEESGLTAMRLTLALVELEASTAQAEAELSEARALALGRLTVAFEDPEPVLPSLPAEDPVLGGPHPLLQARQAEIREAENRARASGRFLQAPELRFGWQTLEGASAKIDGPVVGGSWAMPLFDRRQGEALEWEGRLRAARAQLEADERQVHAARSGAEASYRRLRDAALAAAQALEGSERVIEQAAARFHMGESEVTDLLDAMRSVLSSRMAGLELYAAALEAHRRLELALGHASIALQRGGQ